MQPTPAPAGCVASKVVREGLGFSAEGALVVQSVTAPAHGGEATKEKPADPPARERVGRPGLSNAPKGGPKRHTMEGVRHRSGLDAAGGG